MLSLKVPENRACRAHIAGRLLTVYFALNPKKLQAVIEAAKKLLSVLKGHANSKPRLPFWPRLVS